MIMNRFTNLPLVLTALSLTLVTPLARGAKLSGARPVIDAAEYPSLQAAIDAVPRSSGMLRLPPGEFVISAPLTIRHEDFRLEGAGTATHIKNAKPRTDERSKTMSLI